MLEILLLVEWMGVARGGDRTVPMDKEGMCAPQIGTHILLFISLCWCRMYTPLRRLKYIYEMVPHREYNQTHTSYEPVGLQ